MNKAAIGALCFGAIGALGGMLWWYGFLPSFDEVRASRDSFALYAESHPVLTPLVFSLLYVGAVALSIPIATPLSLLAGFLFGSILGTIIVTLSATIGAIIIFLLARYLFREAFEARAGKIALAARTESQLNGFRDVLVARLVPAVPFSLINLVAGLTRVPLREYALATALGIIPFTFVYVHAGQALGEIESLREVASSEGAMFLSRIALVIVVLYIMKRIHTARAVKRSGEGR